MVIPGTSTGLKDAQPHEIKLLLDRTPIGEFTVQRPANGDDSLIDRNLKIRVPVTAGPHQVGVTFLKNSSSLIETARQPLQSRFNERRHPRITPAISQVSVTGPYGPQGADNTPSRRRIFVCRPAVATGSGEAGPSTAKRQRARADSLHAHAARVPSVDFRGGSGTADGVLSRRTVRARLRCGNRQGVERRAHQSRIPVPRGGGSRQDGGRAPPIASAISSWHPACHFFSGAACPMTRCSIRPFAESSAGQTCSSDTSAECSRILARTISRATSPDSGSGCAT